MPNICPQVKVNSSSRKLSVSLFVRSLASTSKLNRNCEMAHLLSLSLVVLEMLRLAPCENLDESDELDKSGLDLT